MDSFELFNQIFSSSFNNFDEILETTISNMVRDELENADWPALVNAAYNAALEDYEEGDPYLEKYPPETWSTEVEQIKSVLIEYLTDKNSSMHYAIRRAVNNVMDVVNSQYDFELFGLIYDEITK